MDIHVDGLSFGYHYFPSVYLAVFRNLFGISAYTLNIKLLAVVQAVSLAGGFYLLFTLLFRNRWACAGAAAAAVLCCALTLQHMMWYAYATALGMGFALAAAYCFLRFARRPDTVKNGDFLLFLLLLAVAAGVKSILAAGVIAGAGIVLLVWVLRRKNSKQMLLAGILTLAVFAGLYMAMVYGTHAFNGLQSGFATTMGAGTDYAPSYYTVAREALPQWPAGAVKLLVYPLYLTLQYPVTVGSIVLLAISMVCSRREGKAENDDIPRFYRQREVKLFLLGAIVICLAVTSLVSQPGQSQLLFLEGTIPLSAFALFYLAAEAAHKKHGIPAGAAVLCGAVCALLAWNVILTARTLDADRTGLPSRNNSQETIPVYDSISHAEYEGMLWLREHTARDAVFASDRQFYTPADAVESHNLDNARYFYYTAFSERQCYLEGYNYVSAREADFRAVIEERLAVLNGAYQNDPDALARLAADGVDYIVASVLWNPGFELNEAFGERVFANGDIAIYKLYR
jgi:Flp pilus assembly protein protease CpaA